MQKLGKGYAVINGREIPIESIEFEQPTEEQPSIETNIKVEGTFKLTDISPEFVEWVQKQAQPKILIGVESLEIFLLGIFPNLTEKQLFTVEGYINRIIKEAILISKENQ